MKKRGKEIHFLCHKTAKIYYQYQILLWKLFGKVLKPSHFHLSLIKRRKWVKYVGGLKMYKLSFISVIFKGVVTSTTIATFFLFEYKFTLYKTFITKTKNCFKGVWNWWLKTIPILWHYWNIVWPYEKTKWVPLDTFKWYAF